MMSGEPTSTAQMATSALQGSFPGASCMYYMNGYSNMYVDPQTQVAAAATMLPVDAQGIPTGVDVQQLDYHQQKLASQVYGATGHFGEEDENATDQQLVLEGLENPPVPPIIDEVDARSIFVGNVDYGTTPPELQEHFKNCGPINRITIMIDRYTGHPKGYAYIEFQDQSALPHAMSLNQSIFRDRPLKVIPKRKNIPGFSSRGRGAIGRGALAAAAAAATFPTFMKGKLRGRGRGLVGYLPRYRGRGQRGGIYPY